MTSDSLFSVLDASYTEPNMLLTLMPGLLLEPNASGFMEGQGLRLLKWAWTRAQSDDRIVQMLDICRPRSKETDAGWCVLVCWVSVPAGFVIAVR